MEKVEDGFGSVSAVAGRASPHSTGEGHIGGGRFLPVVGPLHKVGVES